MVKIFLFSLTFPTGSFIPFIKFKLLYVQYFPHPPSPPLQVLLLKLGFWACHGHISIGRSNWSRHVLYNRCVMFHNIIYGDYPTFLPYGLGDYFQCFNESPCQGIKRAQLRITWWVHIVLPAISEVTDNLCGENWMTSRYKKLSVPTALRLGWANCASCGGAWHSGPQHQCTLWKKDGAEWELGNDHVQLHSKAPCYLASCISSSVFHLKIVVNEYNFD